jgi:SWI/SNF-related matrix-associated actin-dependent regulator of chromatin subfamily A3
LEAKGLLAKVTKGKTADNSGKDEYRFLLEILLRMRQLCCHQSLCGERLHSLMALASQSRVALTEENTRLLQDVLQLAIEAQGKNSNSQFSQSYSHL